MRRPVLLLPLRRKDALSHRFAQRDDLGERLSIPIAEAVALFVADLELQGRHATANNMRHGLRPLRALAAPTVAHIDTAACRALMRERSLDLAPSSLRTFHSRLAAFFAWCIAEHYLAASPLVGVPKPKERPPRHRWIPSAGLRAMYEACHNDNERLIILLCGTAGLRASELVGLRWRDVDGGHIRVLGKGRKWRELEAGPLAGAVMERMRGERAYVLPFRSINTVRYHVRKLARRAGLGPCTTHHLRHSFAIAWLERTDDAFTLQSLLGHASGRTTAYYVRDVRDAHAIRKQRAVDLAGELFGE